MTKNPSRISEWIIELAERAPNETAVMWAIKHLLSLEKHGFTIDPDRSHTDRPDQISLKLVKEGEKP